MDSKIRISTSTTVTLDMSVLDAFEACADAYKEFIGTIENYAFLADGELYFSTNCRVSFHELLNIADMIQTIKEAMGGCDGDISVTIS